MSTTTGFGQASLVPSYHQVYDWLHYQRVMGHAPYYNYEVLPLTRGQITKVLAGINDEDLNQADKRTRHSYLREFSVDSLRKYTTSSLLQGEDKVYNRFVDVVLSDEEPHVYVWDNEKATIAFDAFVNPASTFVSDGDQDFNSPFYNAVVFRSYGSIFGIAGYHYEHYALSYTNELRTFGYLPFYSRNAKYVLNGDSMHHFEGYAGFHKDFWSFFIGRGTLKHGVGKRDNLVFSREGIPFDWVRLNIDTKYIDYSKVVGFLTWQPRQVQLEEFGGIYGRVSPSRYTVYHRIQFQPASWISFGYYEMVNYSNREFEITYVNPVTRLTFMEFEQDDQDNGFAGFDGTLRPIKGLEIYGEILVDDLGFTSDLLRWNKDKRKGANSNFAHHLGISYALKTGQVFNINYQKVDPNIYAHKFPLNAHSESGFGLGSQIGPNGDELSFNFDQWFSLRSKLSLGYSFNRHGLNFFDEGGEFVDAGGDINDSYFIDPDNGIIRASEFLGGDLHEWNRFSAQFDYYPWRSIKLSADLSYRNITLGEQLEDLMILTFGITIGE